MTRLNKNIYYRYSVYMFAAVILSACTATDFTRLYEGSARPSNEVVKIVVAYALDVLFIDGRKFNTPYTPAGYYQIELLPGKHKVNIFYKEFWGTASGGSLTVSDVFYFEFDSLAGSEYVFQHNGPKDLARADLDNSVSDIKLWLTLRGSDQKIQASGRVAYGSFLNRSIGMVANYDKQSQPGGKTTAKQNSLEQLQYWWKMADDKKRMQFKNWQAAKNVDEKKSTAESESEDETTIQHDPFLQLKIYWNKANNQQQQAFKAWVAERSLDGKGFSN